MPAVLLLLGIITIIKILPSVSPMRWFLPSLPYTAKPPLIYLLRSSFTVSCPMLTSLWDCLCHCFCTVQVFRAFAWGCVCSQGPYPTCWPSQQWVQSWPLRPSLSRDTEIFGMFGDTVTSLCVPLRKIDFPGTGVHWVILFLEEDTFEALCLRQSSISFVWLYRW